MGNLFKKTNWTIGIDEASVSVGEGFAFSVSDGQMFLNDPQGNSYTFDFNTAGGSVSADISPIGFDITTKDMPSDNMILANTKWRNTLSPSDFKGPILIYQGTGISILSAGVTGSLIFFDIGMGLYTSLVGTMLSGGLGAALAPAAVIGSCSAVAVTKGAILGTLGVSAKGALGIVYNYEKQDSIVTGGWKVKTDAGSYKYAFYGNGSCSWYRDNNILTPDGAGRWKYNENHLVINWDSGSVEHWDTPVKIKDQTGSWRTSDGQISYFTAEKTNIYTMWE